MKAKMTETELKARKQMKAIKQKEKDYTISTFLDIIKALDCDFLLVNKEKEHLNPEHKSSKDEPSKAMDFTKD